MEIKPSGTFRPLTIICLKEIISVELIIFDGYKKQGFLHSQKIQEEIRHQSGLLLKGSRAFRKKISMLFGKHVHVFLK